MARPLDVVVEEMLDYIEQASSYVRGMTFEQYASDRKTQRAVERCIEVISEASRHLPDDVKANHPDIPWRDVAGIGNIFRHEYPQRRSPHRLGYGQCPSSGTGVAVRAIAAELPPADEPKQA
jgi:uncharacterized protein with HEPN domain